MGDNIDNIWEKRELYYGRTQTKEGHGYMRRKTIKIRQINILKRKETIAGDKQTFKRSKTKKRHLKGKTKEQERERDI